MRTGTGSTGDGWAIAPDGTRFWGTLGAAGLFLMSPDDHVLMQHRSALTSMGGTWALPGGAIEVNETAALAALRENFEETGIDPAVVTVRQALVTARRPVAYALSRREVLPEDEYLLKGAQPSREWLAANPIIHPEHGSHAIFGLGERYWWEYENHEINEWTYSTVLATAPSQLPVKLTWESVELRWVPIDELGDLPLLPAFRDSLPQIMAALAEPNRPDPEEFDE